mmetsp:Transcript_18162/g.27938  ORF Transcript_18162/g.27938 Transcript_18162/m.27938 type:complete len:227 (-) Transcript_18162:1902-2582(-)
MREGDRHSHRWEFLVERRQAVLDHDCEANVTDEADLPLIVPLRSWVMDTQAHLIKADLILVVERAIILHKIIVDLLVEGDELRTDLDVAEVQLQEGRLHENVLWDDNDGRLNLGVERHVGVLVVSLLNLVGVVGGCLLQLLYSAGGVLLVVLEVQLLVLEGCVRGALELGDQRNESHDEEGLVHSELNVEGTGFEGGVGLVLDDEGLLFEQLGPELEGFVELLKVG